MRQIEDQDDKIENRLLLQIDREESYRSSVSASASESCFGVRISLLSKLCGGFGFRIMLLSKPRVVRTRTRRTEMDCSEDSRDALCASRTCACASIGARTAGMQHVARTRCRRVTRRKTRQQDAIRCHRPVSPTLHKAQNKTTRCASQDKTTRCARLLARRQGAKQDNKMRGPRYDAWHMLAGGRELTPISVH